MRLQPPEPPLVNHEVDVLDEIGGRRPAVAAHPVELARLDRVDDRLEVGRPDAVDALGVDHGAVGEDLEEHAEVAAIVGTAQREPGQDGIGGGDRGAHARPGGQPLRRARWRRAAPGVCGQPAEGRQRSRRPAGRPAGRQANCRRNRRRGAKPIACTPGWAADRTRRRTAPRSEEPAQNGACIVIARDDPPRQSEKESRRQAYLTDCRVPCTRIADLLAGSHSHPDRSILRTPPSRGVLARPRTRRRGTLPPPSSCLP